MKMDERRIAAARELVAKGISVDRRGIMTIDAGCAVELAAYVPDMLDDLASACKWTPKTPETPMPDRNTEGLVVAVRPRSWGIPFVGMVGEFYPNEVPANVLWWLVLPPLPDPPVSKEVAQ